MRLYPIPGGLWAGTEADFKKQCKARGIDAKTLPGSREVPIAKADLIEFLNFYAVDVFRTGAGTDTVVSGSGPAPTVDVEALRAEHNPDPDAPKPTSTDSSADIQLSRMENPGEGDKIDAIVEYICSSSGYALKRFAGAVAGAFSALAA